MGPFVSPTVLPMRELRVSIACLVTTLVAFSGCAEDAATNDDDSGSLGATLVLSDVAGDAREPTDVLGATLSETPESLVIEIAVPTLPQDFSTWMRSDLSWLWMDVCWGDQGSDPDRPEFEACAGLTIDNSGPVADVRAHFGVYDEEGCNDWWWCEWSVPYELTPGTPGKVVITVPRALLPAGDQGDNLTTPVLYSNSAYDAGALRSTNLPRYFAGVDAPVVGNRYASGPPTEGTREKDTSTPGADFTFRTARTASTLPASLTIMQDQAGDVAAAGRVRADLDITAVDLEPTDSSLTWRITVSEVGPAPTHAFYASLGIGTTVLEAWYNAVGGVLSGPGGGYCTPGCNGYTDYPITVEFEPGSPGAILVSIAKADLPDDLYEHRVNLVDFYLYEGDGTGTWMLPVPLPAFASAGVYSPGDWAWGAEPVTYGAAA